MTHSAVRMRRPFRQQHTATGVKQEVDEGETHRVLSQEIWRFYFDQKPFTAPMLHQVSVTKGKFSGRGHQNNAC